MKTDRAIAPRPRTAIWGFMAFICAILYYYLIDYIDLAYIRPYLLHPDPCYYHKHDMPFLTHFLYMGIGSNGHPYGSLKYFFISVILSVLLGHYTVKMIRLNVKKRHI